MATETDEKNSRIYEAGYLADPALSEENLAALVSTVKNLLEKHSGHVISEEFPKMRQMAYNIVKRLGGKNVKFSSAYFGWIKFELEADSIKEIKNGLDTTPNVIRFIILKTVRENTMIMPRAFIRRPEPRKETPKKENEEPKPMMSDAELDKTIEELVVE